MATEFSSRVEVAAEIQRLERLLENLRRTLLGMSSEGLWVLTSRAGTYELALPVDVVLEVVMIPELMSLPDAPPWCAGILNLRGSSVPVLDVSARFARQSRTSELSDYIAVCSVAGRLIGLIVQEIRDLVVLSPELIEPARAGLHIAPYVTGVTTRGGKQLCVLDVSALVSPSDVPGAF
jgi:purine-binding chemotaxis protein CheW